MYNCTLYIKQHSLMSWFLNHLPSTIVVVHHPTTVLVYYIYIQLYCTGLIQNPTTDMSYHAITFMFFVYVTVGMIPHAYTVLS